MIVKLEELKNPCRIKVISNCGVTMIYDKSSNYKRALSLINTLKENFTVSYRHSPEDTSKIEIFAEKENRKDIMVEVKQWGV
jgi:hypothetical protein